MAMQVGGAEGQSYSDINMTPLIDVMLVLLIIFIKIKKQKNNKERQERSA